MKTEITNGKSANIQNGSQHKVIILNQPLESSVFIVMDNPLLGNSNTYRLGMSNTFEIGTYNQVYFTCNENVEIEYEFFRVINEIETCDTFIKTKSLFEGNNAAILDCLFKKEIKSITIANLIACGFQDDNR